MVKLTSLTIFIAFFIIISTIAIYGEPQAPETARSKARPVRKKKTGGVVKAKLEPSISTTTMITPIVALEESPSFESLQIQASGETHISEVISDGDTNPEVITTTSTQTPKKVTSRKVSHRTPSSPMTMNGSAGPLPEGCGECDQEECNTPTDSSCPNGLVLDRCSCCFVCGALEGNRCFNSTLNLPYNPDVGICGPHLDCLLRNDLDPTEPREALCECRDKRIVCGNDHQTYLSECKLREAAHATPGLMVTSWSPCVSAPVITTPVENATVAIAEDVSLSCEVRAYPAPVLHWEFISEGSTGLPQILPGDDSGIVVVVRGGPEQIMTTSWIQLIAVNPKRQGTYLCIAKNTEGSTQTSAEVRVYKNTDDE